MSRPHASHALRIQDFPTGDAVWVRRVPARGKMQRLLGVVPQVPLVEGLRRTVAWFQQARAAAGEGAWR
jgi:nucleoside-diphosphate-sugar epimerase